MPKITRNSGASNAGITRAEFGGHVNAGLTERAAGFSDVTDSRPPVEREPENEPEETDEEVTELPFDPDIHTVNEVNLMLQDCTDAEREAILELERQGQNRTGIVGRS